MKMRLTTASAVLITGTVLGCTNAPTYQGDAKLQQVVYRPKAAAKVSSDVEASALRLVRDADELTGYDDNWELRTTVASRSGSSHVRLTQVHDGVKVWGADVVVHTNGDQFDFVSGTRVPNLGGFDVHPAIAGDHALATAKADYDKLVKTQKTQINFKRESQELVIYPRKSGDTRLAWHVVFFTERQGGVNPGLWNYFIDAKTGEILSQFNGIHHVIQQASGPGGNTKAPRTWDAQLDVKKSGTSFVMDTPRLTTIDMHSQTDDAAGTIVSSDSLTFNDAPVNDAHGYAEVTLNMLSEWFGFQSIDNKGFLIKSRVHYDQSFENAFWDGTQMTYGDGATTFFPLSGDVDVVAHEINHGFTSFHSDLIYAEESGGMNESFSDIAGTTASFFINGDNGDFDIGRDIFKGDEALRFMCDPTKDGISIDNLEDYASQDVHFTSGISNKAFCLSARRLAGGAADSTATQASVRRAAQAWYHANAGFWTTSTGFTAGCQGIMDAAKDLGYTDDEKTAIRKSWVDVGVFCDGEIEPLHCDETITTDHGEIASPNFPANYGDNFKHTYCVIPASGAAATLHFTNFDVEQGFDFVTIKDASGAVVSTSTGTATPADTTSTTIVVKFTSDQSVNNPGWHATW